MITATATEVQNNFMQYLQAVRSGNEVLIVNDGKEVARLISREESGASLTNSLIGVLKNDYDEKKMRSERIEKREFTDRHKYNS